MSVEVIPIRGLEEVHPGDDLSGSIAAGLRAEHIALRDGDVVAVTQKVVSKAEGRIVPERPEGKEGWVAKETRRVVARRDELVVAETRHGFVCANAGVDASNVAEGFLTLLPADPDGSAERIRSALAAETGADIGVIITDTFGWPWRTGVVNVAIGCAGFPAVVDLRGTKDTAGRVLEATIVALADEVAAASGLAMGKADGIPVAVVRGVRAEAPAAFASALVRPPDEDLFRTGPLQAIRDRLEETAFAGRDVPRALVEEAVSAARASPSSIGADPLIFVVVDSEPGRRMLGAAGAEARPLLEGAPVVVVPLLPLRRGLDEAARDARVAAGGAAVQNLLLALSAQGVASSWIPPDRFEPRALRDALGLADGIPLGAVVGGWPRPDP